MKAVSISEAKTCLARLVQRAAEGESIVIVRAGVPVAKLVPIDTTQKASQRRIGFLEGRIRVPDDFDTMGQREIERLFGSV